jgi:hypothetical protein
VIEPDAAAAAIEAHRDASNDCHDDNDDESAAALSAAQPQAGPASYGARGLGTASGGPDVLGPQFYIGSRARCGQLMETV